jgi:hypothetical protein
MNQNILDMIDEIEMQSIYTEMEVCCELLANLEKQSVIIEYAANPEDFEFYMEAKTRKAKERARKQSEKDKQKNAEAGNIKANDNIGDLTSAAPEPPKTATQPKAATQKPTTPPPASEPKQNKYQGTLPEPPKASTPKVGTPKGATPTPAEPTPQPQPAAAEPAPTPAVADATPAKQPAADANSEETKIKGKWLKKLGIYLSKIFTASIRVFKRMILGFQKTKFEDFFKEDANKKKVPAETLSVLKQWVQLIETQYIYLDYIPHCAQYKSLYQYLSRVIPTMTENAGNFNVKIGLDISGLKSVTGTPFKFEQTFTDLHNKLDKANDIYTLYEMLVEKIKSTNKYDVKLENFKVENMTCTAEEFKNINKLSAQLYSYITDSQRVAFDLFMSTYKQAKDNQPCDIKSVIKRAKLDEKENTKQLGIDQNAAPAV